MKTLTHTLWTDSLWTDSSCRRWTRSLRFRLTAWFTAVLALLLLLLAVLLVLGARHILRVETDAFLVSEARHVFSAGDAGDAPDMGDVLGAVASYARISAGLPQPNAVFVRLLDARNGTPLAQSPSLDGKPALNASLDRLALSPSLARRVDFAGPSEEQTVRVLTERGQVGTQSVLVQVAVLWDQNADAIERLTLLLAVSLPALLLTAAAGGWVLVGRTLRPIRRIVTEAENLDVDALPERLLPVPEETDSEIGQLVETLNGMTTRLHHAFEAQRRFASAQQRFAADASHELRTPLTILRGEMELALTRPRSLEVYQATLASGVQEIDRMSRIVEGLSFLARHDADRLRPGPAPASVDIDRLARTVLETYKRQAQEKQISLHAPAGAVPVRVPGNETQLQQLLGNLLDNALKYTLPGGSVTVSVTPAPSEEHCSEEHCLVSVEDTGIGIAPSDLPHIFQRFWQADLSRRTGGSGLGLAICAQIVHLHGGTLSARSTPGQGTCIQVRLQTPAGLKVKKYD